MAKTIVVAGYGPGISDAVARRFGREGFRVALVARSADKVVRAAAALSEARIEARGFSCDLSEPQAVTRLIDDVRAGFGSIDVLHWNAFARLARDLTTCDVSELRSTLDVAVVGLTSALQAALPDLRASAGAVLVTGGGLGDNTAAMDQLAASYAMGLAIAKAAQRKWVGAMHAKLKPENVYVGEVTVLGLVKSSAADSGKTLDPNEIAERFWSLYQSRSEVWSRFP